MCILLLVLNTNNGNRWEYSQLQDQDDLCLVFKHLMKGYDVWVLDFLKDVHFALNVLPRHPAAARFAASLLDKLGSVFHPRASVSASSDHSKLSTRERKRRDCRGCV